MEKIIQTLIDSWTKGVDTYTHNGSTWLIFTDNKQWVIELTDSKTLWYNYNFFKQIFEFTSLDVVDNQQYITKWVEENVINGVRYTGSPDWNRDKVAEDALKNGSIDCVRVNEHSLNYVSHQRDCEDTIENGVKETITSENRSRLTAENIIENGVRHTIYPTEKPIFVVEDTIENGIKETRLEMNITEGEVDDIIQDGVKHTEIGWHQCNNIDDAIEKGVKYTFPNSEMGTSDDVESVINNGVRDTQSNPYENKSWIEGVIKKGVRHTLNTEYMPTSMVEDIIQSGVKHTEYGDWLDGDERLDDIVENGVKKTSLKRGTRPFMVKDTIKNGVKETNPVDVMKFFDNKMEDALQNGVKETLRASYLNVDNVIQDGVKETNYDTDNYTDDVKEVIREGVKETKTPGKDGDILSTIEWMKENKSNSYTKMIDDVIDYGEKINGTYAGGQRQSEKCKSVVEYGTKNPTD
jgi:hypothetical protein